MVKPRFILIRRLRGVWVIRFESLKGGIYTLVGHSQPRPLGKYVARWPASNKEAFSACAWCACGGLGALLYRFDDVHSQNLDFKAAATKVWRPGLD